jgi:hypothetical protein
MRDDWDVSPAARKPKTGSPTLGWQGTANPVPGWQLRSLTEAVDPTKMRDVWDVSPAAAIDDDGHHRRAEQQHSAAHRCPKSALPAE